MYYMYVYKYIYIYIYIHTHVYVSCYISYNIYSPFSRAPPLRLPLLRADDSRPAER